MSNLATEGELDVNSDAGFNALLAQQAGVEIQPEQLEKLEEGDRTVDAGLTTESAPGANRDEHGRFAPAAKPPGESQEGEASEAVDDPLASLLARYDGDAAKALESVARENENAQALIGRQGSELGEVRRELAEMRGRLEERAAQAQAAPVGPAPLVTKDMLDNAISEAGGSGLEIAKWVAQNHPGMLEETFEVWGQYEPYQALAARQDYHSYLAQQNTATPTTDPAITGFVHERSLASALDGVREGMKPGEWKLVESHLLPSLQAAPEAVSQMIVSPDAKTQKDGLDLVVELARGRAIAAATAKARQEQAQVAAGNKTAAMVATGSLRPVAERQSAGGTPQTKEEITKRFHEMLLATETTSVADGLTYGPRP